MFTISDPLSIPLLLISTVAWMGAGFVFFALAYRARSEWVKATFAAMAWSIVGIWLLGVLPSWWLYYADAVLKWGGNGCTAIDSQCIKQTIKDTVVVVQNGAIIGLFILAFVKYQRKFPKQLAPGEAKPEATGGYK